MPEGNHKLCSLARTDLCTWVKGLLDKLMTHLGLGSSMEELWGLLALLLMGEVLPTWDLACLAWGVVLFSWEAWEAWEALTLIECLTTWREACLAWETWGVLLSTWEALSLVESLTSCLPAWVETKMLSAWELFPSWEWPSLEGVMFGGCTGFLGSHAVPRKGVAYLPACLRRN